MSKSLKVKAGQIAMQKMQEQNLGKVIIYENKPRPAGRGRSQNPVCERCKKV